MARVRIMGDVTGSIALKIGVGQGCHLSALCLALYIKLLGSEEERISGGKLSKKKTESGFICQ